MSPISPITLYGKHITLVPLEMQHLPGLTEAVKDGELWKIWYATVPSPERMAHEIQHRLASQERGSMLPFTVMDKLSNTIIGMTTYTDIVVNHKRLEIGWTWYRKSAQKTMVNTECKLLLLTYAFETLQYNAVRLSANSFNHDSRRAIERLGAKFEGILRNHRIMQNGAVCDFYTYSILANEWQSVKVNLQTKLNKNIFD